MAVIVGEGGREPGRPLPATQASQDQGDACPPEPLRSGKVGAEGLARALGPLGRPVPPTQLRHLTGLTPASPGDHGHGHGLGEAGAVGGVGVEVDGRLVEVFQG